MKTVLFFVSSTRHSCFGRLDGVLRYGTKHGWHVQVIERAFHKVDVRETLKFWNPDGIIAECGSGAGELNRRVFGKLPVVYFDRDPKLCKNEMAVMLDSAAVGRMAAKELLDLGLDNFAFVPSRLPRLYWNEDRARTFAADIKAAGKRCFRFKRPFTATPEDQLAALEKWLERLPKPCGIFASNDYVSEEVVRNLPSRATRSTASSSVAQDIQRAVDRRIGWLKKSQIICYNPCVENFVQICMKFSV